jgi:hypothetical protein
MNAAVSIVALLAVMTCLCCLCLLATYCRKDRSSDLVEGHVEMSNWIRDNYESDVLTGEIITNRASMQRRLGSNRFSQGNPLYAADMDLPVAKPVRSSMIETTI